MKSIRFFGPNDMRLEDVDIPPLQKDEVKIKVKAAGICGSDLLLISGKIESTLHEQGIMGHEFSGIITETGKEVTGFNVGDGVAVNPQLYCGRCYYCRKGQFTSCKEWTAYGYKFPGGFAEYVNVKESNILLKPDNLTFEEVALLDPISCGLHGIHRSDLTPTDSTVIIGCGTIGLCILTCAKAFGARKIYAIDMVDERLRKAYEMGADKCLNPQKDDVTKEIIDLTAGEGADIVFEAVGGVADTIPLAMQIVRNGGKIVYLGWFGEKKSIDLHHAQEKEIDILPSWVWGFKNGVDEFEISLDMLSQGKVQVDKIITQFPLKDFSKALELLYKKETGVIKVILNP